jgi:anti-sigma B factor antagonist
MANRDPGELLEAQVVERADGITILHLTGEIDMSSASALVDQFTAISEQRRPNVILDATQVTFIDSTGLHALTEGKRMIHERGTRIFLVPSPQVKRLLELVFPEPLFAARVDSVEEALNQIQLQTTGDR